MARGKLKEKKKIGVSFDLTSDRLLLLKVTRSRIKFAYADIKCKLRILTHDGKQIMFDYSLACLNNIIANI